MKPIHEMTDSEIEKRLASAIVRLNSSVVEAEDDNGNIVQCYLYEGKLLDYDCNELVGFKIKRSWTWLLILSGAVSIWLAHYLITK